MFVAFSLFSAFCDVKLDLQTWLERIAIEWLYICTKEKNANVDQS